VRGIQISTNNVGIAGPKYLDTHWGGKLLFASNFEKGNTSCMMTITRESEARKLESTY
jgi:hypothetical protein